MLKSKVEDLCRIQKQEEFEYKKMIRKADMEKNKKFKKNFIRKKSFKEAKISFQRDHLPFGNMLPKILANMPDAPHIPIFKIQISKELFFFKFFNY